MRAETTDRAVIRAAAWMIGAIISFSAMAVAGRAVTIELDTFELMLYRSLIGVAIVVAVGWATGALGQITTRRMGLHLARNISHFTGQNLWFYSLTLIPLAQLFAIEFSSPLWVTLLAPLVLGERLTGARATAALMGFVGVLIVARPDLSRIDPGTLTAAAAAIGFAGSALFTKRLTQTETILCILFWLTVMQAAFGLICAGLDGRIAAPSPATTPWLVLIGFAGLSAHFCLTRALSMAPAIIVVPIDFARLPVIAIVGMILYDEALNWAVFAGAAVILAANYINLRAEKRLAKQLTQGKIASRANDAASGID